MQCDDVRQRVKRYVTGDLSDADVRAMDDHLDRCEDCATLVNDTLAAQGLTELTPQDEELLRLMRMPTPSPEQVQVGVDAVLRTLQREPVPPAPMRRAIIGSWMERLRVAQWRSTAFAYAFAGVAALTLVVFAWNQHAHYKTLDRQLTTLTADMDTLKRQNASLQQDNVALREQTEQAVASREQTQELLTSQLTTLEQKVAQLQGENNNLKMLLARNTTQPRALVSFRDTQGAVTVSGAVRLSGKTTLPPSLSQSVSELVTTGSVPPSKTVLVAMETLRSDEMRGALRSAQNAEKPKPVPLSPLLTAVRSTRPTLRWKAVPDAQEYQVKVAYPEEKESGKVVWEGSAGTQTQITLPAGALRRGLVYLWQVTAVVEKNESPLSPAVGFYVLDEKALREVESAERKYKTSALALASVYEAHGLYEDALAQVERLAKMNPTSPFMQAMLQSLHRQLGKEQ